jgi:hypothetical protein
MSNDRERGLDERPDQPEDSTNLKHRDAVGRFAKYTAPVMLALTSKASAAPCVSNCV